MGYGEPTGYVECEICGDQHHVDMIQVADGSGGFDCWAYSKDELPEGWEIVEDYPYCPACKQEVKDEVGT